MLLPKMRLVNVSRTVLDIVPDSWSIQTVANLILPNKVSPTWSF